MEWYVALGIFFVIYFIARHFLTQYLVRFVQKKQFQQEYLDVLSNPRYKVKSNYDD